MDKFIELFSESLAKKRYTVLIVLAILVLLLLSGNLLFFIWNRSLYMELDIFKLLLITSGIFSVFYVVNFLMCIVKFSHIEYFKVNEDGRTKDYTYAIFGLLVSVFTYMELIALCYVKIRMKSVLVGDVLDSLINIYIIVWVFLTIGYKIKQKCKSIKIKKR